MLKAEKAINIISNRIHRHLLKC